MQKMQNVPVWQSSPIQPDRQEHLPVAPSHVPPFMHLQIWVQFSPYRPSSHSRGEGDKTSHVFNKPLSDTCKVFDPSVCMDRCRSRTFPQIALKISPSSQAAPVQPGWQEHLPVTPSQELPFSHRHWPAQFSPYCPAGHAGHKTQSKVSIDLNTLKQRRWKNTQAASRRSEV